MSTEKDNPSEISQETARALLEALYSILNVEGPAMIGGRTTHKGLDVRWHFDKVRAAIAKARGEA